MNNQAHKILEITDNQAHRAMVKQQRRNARFSGASDTFILVSFSISALGWLNAKRLARKAYR